MDDLLDDLNDLGSEDEELEEEEELIVVRPAESVAGAGEAFGAPEDEGEEGDSEGGEAGAGAGAAPPAVTRDTELETQLASLSGRTGLRAVARLRETRRFADHLTRIQTALAAPAVPPVVGPVEEWPEYRLILASNAFMTALDEEQYSVHRFLIEAWAPRFPELESVVPAMLDYARAVLLIGNETDMTRISFEGLLTSATVMVVTVTGSTTAGRPLPEAALAEALAAAREVLALEEAKTAILTFIESRMETLAPNVSALLGTRVAAQLLGITGGLTSLSRTPSCNVQVLGQKRKHTAGLARTSVAQHAGVIYDCPLVTSAPGPWKRKAAKVLAAKVVLAARVDAFRQSEGGEMGRELYVGVAAKLAKWQEPPPARAKKALKAPDDKPAKRRGGKRYRAMKERLGMTAVRKEANRVAMTGGGEYDSVAMGTDTGMLGSGASGSGRLRVAAKSGQAAKLLGLASKKRRLGIGQGGVGGGTLSSFAFTPVQGIELVNPEGRGAGAGTSVSRAGGGGGAGGSYFDASGAFSTVVRK
jgi:U4/U6 small nuclear ribonucleoprotein PRP31